MRKKICLNYIFISPELFKKRYFSQRNHNKTFIMLEMEETLFHEKNMPFVSYVKQ